MLEIVLALKSTFYALTRAGLLRATTTMSGLLARVLAQSLMLGVQVLTKAFAAAYARAQAGGGAQSAANAVRSAVSGGAMPLDHARAVLNLEKGYAAEHVEAQFHKYFHANDPDAGGSFYLQSKVVSAHDALVDELRRQASVKKGEAGDTMR